jgi:hypothetical protein
VQNEAGELAEVQDAECKKQEEPGSHRRRGNVAQLPKVVRDRINVMIEDGVTYREIIERLGEDGKDLDPSNLTRWRQGGYQDWLVERAFIERTRMRQETPAELVKDFAGTEVNEAALQLGTLHIFDALRDLESDSESLKKKLGGDCAAFARLINALARASRETMQRAAGDETGLGRQICWEAAKQYGSRFLSVNFASAKHDLGFALMNQLSIAQKRFPRSEQDIAAQPFALRKVHTGARCTFTECRNRLNPASHCDIAWAGALASHAHAKQKGGVWAAVAGESGWTDEKGFHPYHSDKVLPPETAMLWSDDPSIWRRWK